MGPYHNVRNALYMFTHILQVNMKHHSSGAALSLMPTALVTILATDS